MSFERGFQDRLDALKAAGAARVPATLGEIWDTEWRAGALDTVSGVAEPRAEAWRALVTGLETETGRPLAEIEQAYNMRLTDATTFDEKVMMLGRVVDALPEEARQRLTPLRDVEANARKKAQALDREKRDVGEGTYGLAAHVTGFIAGAARQMIEPVNIGSMALGGPANAPLRTFLAREFMVNAGAQALQEPFIQTGRASYGLEAGFGQAAGNVLTAGIGGAGLAGLLRGAGYLARRGYDAAFGAPDGPAAPTGAARADLEPEAFEAAGRYHEARELGDRLSPDQSAAGVHQHAEMIEGARTALESGRLAEMPAAPVVATPPARIAELRMFDEADDAGRLPSKGRSGDGQPATGRDRAAGDSPPDLNVLPPRSLEPAPERSYVTAAAKEPRALPAPPQNNYRTNLAKYSDRLYREMRPGDISFWIPTGRSSTDHGDVYFSHTRDLALGQGDNRGAVIEVDANAFEGQINRTKPAWDMAWRNNQAEFVARDVRSGQQIRQAVSAVELPKRLDKQGGAANIVAQKALDELVALHGWRRFDLDNGRVRYERPDATPAKIAPPPATGRDPAAGDSPPDLNVLPPRAADDAPGLFDAGDAPASDLFTTSARSAQVRDELAALEAVIRDSGEAQFMLPGPDGAPRPVEAARLLDDLKDDAEALDALKACMRGT